MAAQLSYIPVYAFSKASNKALGLKISLKKSWYDIHITSCGPSIELPH